MPADDLPPDAARALARWKPDLASDEHAPLIRELAAAYRPKDRKDALKATTALSGLVYWAERTGRPVTAAALMTPAMVDHYADAELTRLAVSTHETQRSALHRVLRGLEGRLDGHRAHRGKRSLSDPYTPAEADALLLWAHNQPSAVRRHALLALLVLGLGAGLGSADIAAVRADDISEDPATGAVLVRVRGDSPRTVPVLARYEQDALRLAAAARTGTRWIVNPAVEPAGRTSDGLISTQIKAAPPPTDAPPLLQARCRITWICRHLEAGTRVDVLAAAGGYKDANMPARYARHLKPPPAADAVRMLRDAPPV